jgi:hypothetical protein
MRSILVAAAFAGCLGVCATGTASAQSAGDQIKQTCTSGFTVEGGFFRGRTFHGAAEVQGVTTAQAVQRIAQALALQNQWHDIRADRDIGTVSAAMGVTFNDAAQVPLNIVVQEKDGGGLALQAGFFARGGLMVELGPLKELMCGALAAAAG